MNLAIAIKNARLQAIADAANSGADSETRATLTFYAGSQPSSVATAVDGQTLLAEVECPYPLESDITNGVMTLASFDSVQATGEGQATWARLRDVGGTALADFTVGEYEEDGEGNDISEGDIIISSTQMYPGVLVEVYEGTIAEA